MRISLVIERFEPGTGGLENVAWQVAHRLARTGDEVRVVTRRAAPTSLPVECVRVPTAWQPLRVLAFSRAAARAAPRGSADVVYSFARTLHQDVYRAGSGSHADYLERRGRGAARALRRLSPRHAVLLDCERRIFADPSQLVQCGSEMVQREISGRYGLPAERLVVVRNAVDTERFRPDAEARAAVRSEWDAGDAPVWLLVGKGFARKGLDTALRALARGRTRNARLWVVGPDAPAAWLALARGLGVAERVRFVGARDDLPRIYPAADALLLPTRYDAFANVTLEAAAAGLPVVTTRANGAADALEGAGRFLADASDVQACADALDELADPDLRRALGEAARAAAEANGWEAHLEGLRRLFARARSH